MPVDSLKWLLSGSVKAGEILSPLKKDVAAVAAVAAVAVRLLLTPLIVRRHVSFELALSGVENCLGRAHTAVHSKTYFGDSCYSCLLANICILYIGIIRGIGPLLSSLY
jgi:hypothetical protein